MKTFNLFKFFNEAIDETKKLTFPNRYSILAGTVAVFVFSIILSLYTFLIDFITSQIIAYIIKLFS
jgi:preprotein translocase SecE subunit